MKSVDIEIFGRKFHLRTDKPKELQDFAKAIDEELRQLSELYENLDFPKLLLLLLLKKHSELKSLQNNSASSEKELERLNQMVGTLVEDL
ncbi:MAG: cell division protein ZapA [Candidatus Cloacimonadaceae bacterium]|jgi:cell division protein ZapA (FtsZ GTPase activity inhibitor)|nr:cell division protein ZapA [Candidatus Cloacimonadota bacterium]MDX9949029.1 cell division protein ZapA [Candidatus Syntrophosphaera sp.]NLN85788.1 cell division protein ZapA [Candidatus Cloacimonadota bacterium]